MLGRLVVLLHALTLVTSLPTVFALPKNPSRTGLSPTKLDAHVRAGAEVFGTYTTCNKRRQPLCNWLSSVSDSTQLTSLSLPGTHDTATWGYTPARQASLITYTGSDIPPSENYRCQTKSIIDQLHAGIRTLDLRVAYSPDQSTILFWHSVALLSIHASLEDVLFGLYKWLDDNPSETVVVSIKAENTPTGANDERFQQTLLDLLSNTVARRYFVQTRGTLADLTLRKLRGKILLLSRLDFSLLPASSVAQLGGLDVSSGWSDNDPSFALTYNSSNNAAAHIEDLYELDVGGTSLLPKINLKLNATTSHLDLARTTAPSDLWITFASGSSVSNEATPRDVALGDKDRKVREGVNRKLLKYLKPAKNARARKGIVFLDFYEGAEGLVGAIAGVKGRK